MLQKFATFVAAAGLVFAVGCGQTDAGITTNVKTKLATDDTVRAYQIDVDTQNGVVTLRGEVETAAAKTQAVQIARGTDGVRDVVDQIRVTEAAPTGGVLEPGYDPSAPEGRDAGTALTDAAITSAVKAKFLADTTVRGLKIDVDTRSGVVVLNGTVASRQMADRAVMLARETEGVDQVVDNLKVGQ